MAAKTTVQSFGKLEGRTVNKFTITQGAGIQVSVINYGATVTSIIVPDKTGSPADVVLGFDTLEGYIRSGKHYFGAICGRYANRIANAAFGINGNEYHLSNNDGISCLHGGFKGFDKKYWDAEVLPEENGVRFSYRSLDDEEGFPGNVDISVTYIVAGNELHIKYAATTDKATPINITSHCYFNLSGGYENTILNHQLQLNAGNILEVDEKLIPTGNMKEVRNTTMDFTEVRKIGVSDDLSGEYDNSWVLKNSSGKLEKAVSLIHSETGIKMTVFTTQPSIHFYSGHFLDGNFMDTKKGKVYGKYAGLCLEAQHFPDSPNHPGFPNTILKPGEVYAEKTVYKFSNENIR
ncbi:MAG: galactose mutarotase [Chitinophagaceae bacterium]|nr:galactose mutarotase [Chitinophagaceae bacterium]